MRHRSADAKSQEDTHMQGLHTFACVNDTREEPPVGSRSCQLVPPLAGILVQ